MSTEYWEQEIEEAYQARHKLLVAAQWILTERLDPMDVQRRVNWVERDKFGTDLRVAAHEYVQAVNLMTSQQPLATTQRPWDLNNHEQLENQVTELLREVAWRKGSMERTQAALDIMMEHYKTVGLPEDVRLRVVAAMGGER